MVGRTEENGTASLRALRKDLIEALRTCDAGKPDTDRRRNRLAALPEALVAAQGIEKPVPFAATSAIPRKASRATPGRSAQIRDSFQAELSPDVDEAVGFIGRSFALPEVAALLSLGGRAMADAGARLLGEPRTSHRRISASRLKAAKPLKFRFAES